MDNRPNLNASGGYPDNDGHRHQSTKRAYTTPVLTAHGDLRSVVLAGTDPFPTDSTSGTPRQPRTP